MTITRDPEVAPRIAELMAAFNACADGHDIHEVIGAAAEMFSASIHNYAAAFELSDSEFEALAKHNCDWLLASLRMNWKRRPQPTDIEVKPQ